MIGLVGVTPNQHRTQVKSKSAGATRRSAGNRKVKPRRKTNAGLWIVVMVLLFAETLLYVWCRMQCFNTGIAIDEAQRTQEALSNQRKTLNIELARLRSPERIEAIARTRLGLVMPDSHQRVMLP